jgi:hypothetical protein
MTHCHKSAIWLIAETKPGISQSHKKFTPMLTLMKPLSHYDVIARRSYYVYKKMDRNAGGTRFFKTLFA